MKAKCVVCETPLKILERQTKGYVNGVWATIGVERIKLGDDKVFECPKCGLLYICKDE